MHKNAQKVERKTREQNVLPLHMATPWPNLPVSMTLSWKFFLTASKPSRRPIIAAKTKEKEKKEKRKKS